MSLLKSSIFSFFMLLFFLPVSEALFAQPTAGHFTQNLPVNLNRFGFNEPSGIVFHPERKTLFVVGDEGDICELTTDGVLIKKKHIRDADFEAVTCSLKTGLLYIAVEGDEVIVELHPEDFSILRVFWINRFYRNNLVIPETDDGIEGITCVENPDGTEYLLAANQSDFLMTEQDFSLIMRLDIAPGPPVLQDQDCRITSIIKPGVIDIRGLFYSSNKNQLFVLSNWNNAVFVFDLDGKLKYCIPVPGKDQEGITVDDRGNIYIAQDSGKIYKYACPELLR